MRRRAVIVRNRDDRGSLTRRCSGARFRAGNSARACPVGRTSLEQYVDLFDGVVGWRGFGELLSRFTDVS